MFDFQDLFQWDRFITPTIIKTFYWLVIALICLLGVSGIFSGLAAMAISPFAGFLVLLSSIASVIVGIVFCRIARGIHPDRVPHQRAPWRDPRSGSSVGPLYVHPGSAQVMGIPPDDPSLQGHLTAHTGQDRFVP